MKGPVITVVGGGLAGSEAAWQAARMGVSVHLYEMRPKCSSEVHKTGRLAELVCSNSLGTDRPDKAPGILKEDLRTLGSLIMQCADRFRVPAGQALAVDREMFSRAVTDALESRPEITIHREEVEKMPPEPVVVATGPVTSPAFSRVLLNLLGRDHLYFYDAVSPIISGETIDRLAVFAASRYEDGEGDYLNCPLTLQQYQEFREALRQAERVPYTVSEPRRFFEGCVPVEELAERGEETLRYGPMKPVGLRDPKTGKVPYAVVQLRSENREKTMYSPVGFQTRLLWGEQRRVFRMLPGLSHASFFRYGVMHRNIFIHSPSHLLPSLQQIDRRGRWFAGQMVGVEGYLESTAAGLVAGVNAALYARGLAPLLFPRETAVGALLDYVSSHEGPEFQPMNINFGLFPAETQGENGGRSKVERHRRIALRSRQGIEKVRRELERLIPELSMEECRT
ncbi:MAG: methylenetetrahydrofolate--tRNA-(uracil(54)-C(5))-methyltransferase (FADH(2)-oxidizing) TrmFO [Armatimonadetes bacterium]|nr:methylenetetrahydrofolate--tRNA-(uracil(54)-C(5))-methyltransferase (FADH(2)-oxidizing) TrmFO [Armatimonadota bacterium]